MRITLKLDAYTRDRIRLTE